MRVHCNIKERHPQSAVRAYRERANTESAEVVLRFLDMDGGEVNVTMTPEQATHTAGMLESEVAKIGLGIVAD